MMEKEARTATVFNIERSSSEDGPGIRTVVFLKGCSMRCKWCANPESQSFAPEILVNPNACIHCGKCEHLCPSHAIHLSDAGAYVSDPEFCTRCGLSVKNCNIDARSIAGTEYTVQELVREVLRDKPYFQKSGGGVTFSGGEPLLHAQWLAECAEALHREGISVLIETCGFVSPEQLKIGAEAADYIFCDLKEMDEKKHREFTGQSNARILENIRWLDENFKGRLSIRCPVIPGCNDDPENIRATLDFISTLHHVQEFWFLPYHRLGLPKYEGLGRVYPMGDMKSLKFADIAYLKDDYQKDYSFEIRI